MMSGNCKTAPNMDTLNSTPTYLQLSAAYHNAFIMDIPRQISFLAGCLELYNDGRILILAVSLQVTH